MAEQPVKDTPAWLMMYVAGKIRYSYHIKKTNLIQMY